MAGGVVFVTAGVVDVVPAVDFFELPQPAASRQATVATTSAWRVACPVRGRSNGLRRRSLAGHKLRLVRKNLAVEELGDLIEQPLVAVLATHRRDGSVLLSPVWHEWRDGGFNVVTSSDDVKAQHLGRDPRANILVYEHEPPYRGVELRGDAQLLHEPASEAARRIAVRYVGEAAGSSYAERGGSDILIRLEPGTVRAWDFSDEFSSLV